MGSWDSRSALVPCSQLTPSPMPSTYLLMREAKGCTCREVPMMMRRSTLEKSCREQPGRTWTPLLGLCVPPPLQPSRQPKWAAPRVDTY